MSLWSKGMDRSKTGAVRTEDDKTNPIDEFFASQPDVRSYEITDNKNGVVNVDGSAHLHESDLDDGELFFKIDRLTGNLYCHCKHIKPSVVPTELGGEIIFVPNEDELWKNRQAAEGEDDWVLAKNLKDTMSSVSGKGRNLEAQLRTKFFNLMEEMGVDTHLLKIDMSIDLFGWMATLDLVISMSDGVPVEGTSDKTLPSDVEETKVTTTITTVSSAEKVMEDKTKKTRKRIKWIGILQYSLDGKLLREWKSITEASKTLNLNHASISKCVNGHYKKAEGYRWEGIKEPEEELTLKAAA